MKSLNKTNSVIPDSIRNLYKVSTLFFFLFISSKSAFAESAITAIPPRLQLEASPGDIINTTIKVRNESDISQTYSVYVNDFIVNDSSGTPVPISENITSRWSLRKWIVAPEILPVDSKYTQNVNLTIRVPSTALPGGHYAMVTFMPNGDVKPNELKKTATIIGQRVGTLIYVTIKGNITEKANLINFNTPKFSEKGPIELSGEIENLSDIHIQPKGFISITDFFNKEVAKLPLELANIFPGNNKTFVSNWDQKWGYGRYKAELNLIYGTSNSVMSGTIFFWLFPIRLIIYILIAISSILTIIILLNKRSRRHQDELEMEVKELQKEIKTLEKK